jgi:hypothetical protein
MPSRLTCRLLLCFVFPGLGVAADSWPQFRGPAGDGRAGSDTVPIEFGETQHVTWKTALPGRAWSSPVVAEGLIWVTTAVERVPSEEERVALLRESGIEEQKIKQLAIAKSIELQLLAVDLESGSLQRVVPLTTIARPDPIHALNSYASPTPVIDGPNIHCHFGTYGTFCVDRASGRVLWKRELPLEHGVGPGSSPLVHGPLLVLIQDGMDRQYVTALDKQTGDTIWEQDRPEMDAPDGDQKKSYCTPIAITDKLGREQLICMGSQWMVSYQPQTGEEIWRVYHGKGFSVVPRPVHQDGVVYFATGFGKPELWAVRVDGDGDVTQSHVLWTVLQGIPAKPSPLLHEGLIYVISDSGVASCFDIDAGREVWKQRIGGDYSSSPTLAGGHIYIGSQDGKVTVIEPGPEGRIVAENQLAGQIMASPAVVGGAMVWRTDTAIYRIE